MHLYQKGRLFRDGWYSVEQEWVDRQSYDRVAAEVIKIRDALTWALREGAKAVDYGNTPIEFRDRGCGCCSGEIHPPEEIRNLLIDAGRAALGKRSTGSALKVG